MLALGLEPFELHMAVERQVFLGGIQHLHEMAAHAAARIMAIDGLDLVQRVEPVGDQHDGAVRRQRHQRAAGLAACWPPSFPVSRASS